MNGRRREKRAAECETGCTGDLRIETEGREDIPGRYGTTIVVTRQAAGAQREMLRFDATHNILRAIRRAREIVLPGGLKLRLIAYKCVRTRQARIELFEVIIQALQNAYVAAHHREQVMQVVGNHPGVLGAITLYKACAAGRSKAGKIGPIGITRRDIAAGGIKKVFPILGTL